MPLTSTATGRSVSEFISGDAEATSSTTDEPDGITAPFAPVTGCVSIATKRSPGRLLAVQTFCCEVIVKKAPGAMVLAEAVAGSVFSRRALPAWAGRCTGRVRGASVMRCGFGPALAVSQNCGWGACEIGRAHV